MELIDKRTIRTDKVINELDKLTFHFIRILEKYADYVVISGYVAILLGRSRATEDVDVFIREISRDKFLLLYEDLRKNGYWCLNAEDADEVYAYLSEGLAVRFAMHEETIPNFEVKFAKKKLAAETFNDFLQVITKAGSIKVSSLERQIAFKRYQLKSDKDLEDAKHIEDLFREHLNFNKIEFYRKQIEDEAKNEAAKARKG